MALFGKGGAFGEDGFFETLAEDVSQAAGKNYLKFQKEVWGGIGKGAGEIFGAAAEGFGKGMGGGEGEDSDVPDITSELAIKDDLRRESDLIKARQTRAKAGNLLSSQNNMPSLLG